MPVLIVMVVIVTVMISALGNFDINLSQADLRVLWKWGLGLGSGMFPNLVSPLMRGPYNKEEDKFGFSVGALKFLEGRAWNFQI